MTERQIRYLAELAQNPGASSLETCRAASVSLTSRAKWRHGVKGNPEFRREEDRIRLLHRAEQKRASLPIRVELDDSPPPPIEERLDPRLARYLEVYEAEPDRLAACAKLAEEGVALTWEEVEEAIRRDKEFSRRFGALWQRTYIKIEDQVRIRAAGGNVVAGLKVLAAENPKKYGNKLRVEHGGRLMLGVEHAQDVEAAKRRGGAIDRWRRDCARTALPAAAESIAADVVEGELMEVAR